MSNQGSQHDDEQAFNPQTRAQSLLNETINAPSKERAEREAASSEASSTEGEEGTSEPGVLVEEALADSPVLEYQSDRQKIRLLILTRDLSVTSAGSLAQKRMLELSEMFAEIHLIVLSEVSDALTSVSRISHNVWMYPTNSRFWWKTAFDAYRIAKEQLTFGEGFRADIVLAEDPFESGIAGYYIADKFDRPFEVHIFEDFYDPTFKYKEEHNALRLYMARYSLGKADCVRTKSEYIKNRIVEHHKRQAKFTEVLPIYHNLLTWRDATPTLDLRELFPQFKFIKLHATFMKETSHTDRVITGSARILTQYPTIGLVIVGDGPNNEKLQEQVVALGLSEQVAFLPSTTDLSSCMKSAHLLLSLSEDPEEEFIILQAAAIGLPMVAGVAGLSGELFLDGESAFICQNDSPPCLSEKINRFLNDNQLRMKFAHNAETVVFESIEQDYGKYLIAYRDSIERCVALEG